MQLCEEDRIDYVIGRAQRIGLTVEEDHVYLDDELMRGYWIVDPVTGEGPWPDENFSSSLDEVLAKLDQLEVERA